MMRHDMMRASARARAIGGAVASAGRPPAGSCEFGSWDIIYNRLAMTSNARALLRRLLSVASVSSRRVPSPLFAIFQPSPSLTKQLTSTVLSQNVKMSKCANQLPDYASQQKVSDVSEACCALALGPRPLSYVIPAWVSKTRSTWLATRNVTNVTVEGRLSDQTRAQFCKVILGGREKIYSSLRKCVTFDLWGLKVMVGPFLRCNRLDLHTWHVPVNLLCFAGW